MPAGGVTTAPGRLRTPPGRQNGPACEELAGLGQGKMRVTPDDAEPRKRGWS